MSTNHVILMVLVAACSKSSRTPPPPQLTAEERAQLDAVIGPLQQEISARGERRKAGITAALAAAPKLGGACPIAVDLPDPRERPRGFDLERMKREVNTLARVDLTFHKGDSPSLAHAPLVTHAERQLAMARSQPFAAAQKTLDEVRDAAFWDYDVIIVEDARVDAKAGEGEFTGGRIRGRAVLWSYAESKVRCMSEIDVGSSEKIRTTKSGADTALAVDLMQNALREGLRALRVVE